MYKKTLTLLITCFFLLNSQAQDVVVHSKKSDDAAVKLSQLIKAISQADILKSYSLDEFNILTTASSALKSKEHEFSEEFTTTLKELATKLNDEFNSTCPKIPKETRETEVPKLTESTLAKLKEMMADLLKKETSQINADLKTLTIEANTNNDLLKKLKSSKANNAEALIQGILTAWKKQDETAITSTTGKPFEGIKKLAHKTTLANSEKSFPVPEKKILEANAAKIYRLYKVGDRIKFTHGPTPSVNREVDDKIKAITSTKVLFQFSKVLIQDIKDKMIKDGLQPNKTRANRDRWIKDQKTAIRKKRSRFYLDNLQLTANKLIAENEAKGYILFSGKWRSVVDIVSKKIDDKLTSWKTSNENLLEKAHIEDRNLINVYNEYITPFTQAVKNTYAEAELKFTKDSTDIINQVSLGPDNSTLSDEELEQMQKAREEKTRLEKEAKLKRVKEKIKDNQTLSKINKQTEIDQARTDAEESQSKWILIGVVMLIIIAGAVAAFNPKIRAKVIGSGGKKKSMQDIVSNLQAPGTQTIGSLPPGIAPPTQVAPTSAPEEPAPALTPEKTQIDLDGGISIDRGSEDVAQAAPRKKISLNLGGSSVALSDPNAGGLKTPGENSPVGKLNPPGGLKPPGGGLKPPGGGLKPPGGGLTPPGGLKPPGGDSAESNDAGDADKSNLILNPNLDGGDKLRLNK